MLNARVTGTTALVDLAAIAHNTRLLAAHTRAQVLVVVKADGFGHGLVPVARAALANGATWLGVTSLAEAHAVREAGLTAPVLSWLHHPEDDFAPAIRAGIEVAAPSRDHLAGIAAAATRAGGPAAVHLKIDTGMARNGATPDDWPELVTFAAKLEEAGLIRVRGVWSHLAHADLPGPVNVASQLSRFTDAVAVARAAGLDPDLRHLANSAATFAHPDTHFDLVRAGIAVYGVEPVEGVSYGLVPAMTLRSEVIMVRRVPAGTGVSYRHDYVTDRPTTLALVPLGFADGVPRAAGPRASVLLGGVRRPIAGRITMDQFVVDAGDLPVRPGDEVVVFGPGTAGEPTVSDWAIWAGTNEHEILTGIGGRVPRRYRGTPAAASRVPRARRPPRQHGAGAPAVDPGGQR